jgi:hypothetical protein
MALGAAVLALAALGTLWMLRRTPVAEVTAVASATPEPAPTALFTPDSIVTASPTPDLSTPSPVSTHTATPEPTAEPTTAPTAEPTPEPPRTRMRLDVQHPLQNGRLIVWLDGVLVVETKLSAEATKRIVAIKVREGRVEKMLDVAPGRHEVKVEIAWDGKRRTDSKVVDVVQDATGLLEVRLARVTNDLTLEWTALAP